MATTTHDGRRNAIGLSLNQIMSIRSHGGTESPLWTADGNGLIFVSGIVLFLVGHFAFGHSHSASPHWDANRVAQDRLRRVVPARTLRRSLIAAALTRDS